MPFTFSHPAIILPLGYLSNRWFSLTGLIIGSLTPDFEYFIRMKVRSDYSHTIAGLLWFDLPVGLLLSFVFHTIVKQQFFNNLPVILKSRIIVFEDFSWKSYFKSNWFIVLISIMLGAASHLFWDSFTHPDGYFVNLFTDLATPLKIFSQSIPIFKILQHVSTLTGGFIIIYALYRLPVNRNVSPEINLNYWLLLVGLIPIILTFRFLSGQSIQAYGHIIVSIIAATIASFILTPLILNACSKIYSDKI